MDIEIRKEILQLLKKDDIEKIKLIFNKKNIELSNRLINTLCLFGSFQVFEFVFNFFSNKEKLDHAILNSISHLFANKDKKVLFFVLEKYKEHNDFKRIFAPNCFIAIVNTNQYHILPQVIEFLKENNFIEKTIEQSKKDKTYNLIINSEEYNSYITSEKLKHFK